MAANIPLSVMHVAKSLGEGGTEKTAQLFVTHLDRSRYAPCVYSPADGARGPLLRKAGVPTYICARPEAVLQRVKPAIIHVHRAGWPDPALMRPFALYARAHPEVRIVETNVFGRYDPTPWGMRVDRVLFVSQFCARRYEALYGVNTADPRFQVLYNPVDASFLSKACGAPEERDYSRPVIGRVSRADPGKWSRLALDFLPELAKLVPDFSYRVVGGIDMAREYVRENGFEDRVTFHDPFVEEKDLAAFLNGISVFAHANDTGESFGLCIAEAMAAGLPVVTHPSPFPKDNAQVELVEHGRTGFVAEGPEEYAAALAWLVRNPDEARRMGRAGREKALSLYDAPVVAGQLARVYDNLIENVCGD